MKVLWAIDAAEHLSSSYDPMVKILRQLSSAGNVSIVPFSLVSRHRYSRFLQEDGTVDRINLESELTQWLKNTELPGLQPVKTVIYDSLVPSMIAAELIGHARDLDVDALAAATHVVHAPKRWLLGSVCETLLRNYNLPLILCRVGAAENKLAVNGGSPE